MNDNYRKGKIRYVLLKCEVPTDRDEYIERAGSAS
jgi:hypothetical protein